MKKKHLRALQALLLGVVPLAQAQEFPSRSIRVIVGFPAGSIADLAGRSIAAKMQPKLGQSIIVENRVGASGTIGAQAVVNAPPDGYTMYFGPVTGLHPVLVKSNAVDAGKSLSPVSESADGPFVLFVSSKLPVHNMQELIAYSKSHPGKLNFALSLSSLEMVAAGLKESAGITYTQVDYKSTVQIIPAMLSGEADLNVNILGAFIPYLKDGTIRALAVTSNKRMPQIPDVPSTDELGIPGLSSAGGDAGFWAPLNTPRPVILKLSTTAAEAVKVPEVSDQLKGFGYVPVGSTPEEQRVIFDANMKFWSDAARKINFQPQ